MEENSEGQCDSDVSDSWSVVNYKSDDPGDLANKDNKIISSFHVLDGSNNIDECFELTEVTAQELVENPLPKTTPKFVRINESLDSEGDTDGISVISEDEECVNWKQAAHQNYQTTMELLDTSSDSPFLRRFSTEEIAISTYEDDAEIEADNETENETISVATEMEVSLTGPIKYLRKDGQSNPANNQRGNESLPRNDDDSWQETCTNFLNKYFFTSAVFAAITCIALAQFLKTHGTKDKVVEMLEVIERLRVENELIKVQLNNVTAAYAELERKIKADQEFTPKVLPCQRELPSKNFQDRDDLLTCLRDVSETSSFALTSVTKNLYSALQAAPQEKLDDLKEIEVRVANTLGRLLTGLENMDRILLRLRELNIRVNKRMTDEVKKPGIKIVQWYPVDDDVENSMDSSPENIESENVPKEVSLAGDSLEFMNSPGFIEKDSLDSEDDIISTADLEAPHPDENVRLESVQNMENERLTSGQTEKLILENKKQKVSKKQRRAKGKKIPDVGQETVPQFERSKSKYEKNTKKKMRQVRSFDDDNQQRRVKSWYVDKKKVRERTRTGTGQEDSCSSNITGEWYSARGKAREEMREVDVKAMWYLRRMWRSATAHV